eukprot:7989893-Alexandrium_andersonii.AAC.1
MAEHPKFAKKLARLGGKRIWLWMKSYGAESPKGTHLYGNTPYLGKLRSSLPRDRVLTPPERKIVTRATGPDGRALITGGPGLKPTQAYPPMFGVQVALAHKEWLEAGRPEPETDSESECSSCTTDSYSCIDDLVEEACA